MPQLVTLVSIIIPVKITRGESKWITGPKTIMFDPLRIIFGRINSAIFKIPDEGYG